jgi:hypothetical protein
VGTIHPAQPVKLFVGLLAQKTEWLDLAIDLCAGAFGPVESRGEVIPFTATDYYDAEMGSGLLRQFVTFEGLYDPERLPGIKHTTNALEEEIARRLDTAGVPRRPVNTDPGYVSMSHVVLATTKNYSHRLYLGQGIYGEVTLYFHKGTFTAWPWTYPDYRSEPYIRFFNGVRSRYLVQLRYEPGCTRGDAAPS